MPGYSLPKSLDLLSGVNKAKDSELTVVIAVAHIVVLPILRAGEKSHDTGVTITWGNPEQHGAEHFLLGGRWNFASVFIETSNRVFNRQAFAIYAKTFADSPYFLTNERPRFVDLSE